MDDISFDPNLIDCFLNGEGDYDFLISMLRNLTQDEIGTLVQKIGDTFNHHVGDADMMPMLTLKRILQILHVAKTVDVPFTWEQYQAILEPFMHLCASITNIDMLKVVYLALNEHLEHPTFLQVIMNDDALRPSIAQMGKQLLTVGDYECQAVVFETMIRISYNNRQMWSLLWFADEQHIKWFNAFPRGEFEKICRGFLNILNDNMDDQRVFSYVAKCAFIDNVEVGQPTQIEFWIDFNYGSSSISFYCTEQEPNSETSNPSSWETIYVTYDLTLSCHLRRLPEHGLQEVIVYLRHPYFESQAGTTALSTSTEEQKKRPQIKIVFDDAVELWYHLEYIFKSFYKGQSIDIDGDVPDHLMNGSDKNNQELATGNPDIEQDASTFASRGGQAIDLDSDNELQIDEQFPTSTPIPCAGQVQFQNMPHLQLTPLPTMTTQHNGMNSEASDRQFSQNSSFNEDTSGSNSPDSSALSSQRDFPLIGNVFSQHFTHSQLLASLGKEKRDSSSCDDNGSTEPMFLLSQIKKEVISSSENSLLEGLEPQPDYNIKEAASENLEDLPFYDQASTEKNDENEEEDVVQSQATKAKESSMLVDGSILVEKKKSSAPKSKIVRQKPGLKPTASSAILTSDRKASTAAKRKRSVAWSDLPLPEASQQKEDVSVSTDLVDNSKISNSLNASLKTISGNTRKDLGNKKKATNKARGGRKIQQVDKDDVSIPIQDAATLGASPAVKTTEPIGETPHRRSILKKTVPTQNASSKASSRGKKQTSSNTASSVVKSAVTIPLRDIKMMTRVLDLVKSRKSSLLPKKNRDHGVEAQLSKLAEITVTPHVHKETEVTPSSPEPNLPLPEDQNGDAAASLKPLDFSDPIPSLSNKNTADDDDDDGKVHLGASKPVVKTGRKRTSLFNVNSEKRADFSPVEIDKTAAVDQCSHGKSNAKGAKNVLSKKSRQPSAKAKKLLSTSSGSRPVDDMPSSSSLNDNIKENDLSPSEEYGSDDYGLYVTPISVSKSKTRRSFKTPERKHHSKDSGFETGEKGTLTATPGSLDVLHKKENKISADDKVPVHAVTEENATEMPKMTPMDDSDDQLRDSRLTKKQKVSKVNRKAAVSSMKKTKQILQPVVNDVHAGESDSPSIVELKPDEPLAGKGSKPQNAAINMEDSDSDPSWLNGDKPPTFETSAKTYTAWKSKCEERFKTEPKKKSRKSKAKASVESKDTQWLDIEEFHLEVESTKTQKSRISHSQSSKSVSTKSVTEVKANSEGTSKSIQSSSNAHKGKKTTKLTLPTSMPSKIQKMTTSMSRSTRFDPAEGSTSPNQLGVPEDYVPFTEEPEIVDNEETDLWNVSNSLPLVKALNERKKSFETGTNERFSKSFQNRRRVINSHETNRALSRIPGHVSPSSPSSDGSVDDLKIRVPATLNADSESSSEGSIRRPESTADHALDVLMGCRKTLKRMRSPTYSRMPTERTTMLEKFLNDAISNSSASAKMRQTKEKLAKNMLLAKRNLSTPGPSGNFDPPAGMFTSGHPGSFMGEERSLIPSLHFANMPYSSESSSFSSDESGSFSSDESLSSIDESTTLASNFEKEWHVLRKFTNTAQMMTSNVYQTMISLQEDYLKMLNDFKNEGHRMVLEPSALRDSQRKKMKFLRQMRSRLRKLGDAIKVYRSKEKRFEKAFMFMKQSNFKAYAKKRSQAKKMTPHSQKKQMFKDLRKMMYETSPHRYLAGLR